MTPAVATPVYTGVNAVTTSEDELTKRSPVGSAFNANGLRCLRFGVEERISRTESLTNSGFVQRA